MKLWYTVLINSPNYNYQPSPQVSVTRPDLSTTVINLANIQSRSLDLMVANQKSQQDVYNELTRANRDKANDAMVAAIKTTMVLIGKYLKNGLMS